MMKNKWNNGYTKNTNNGFSSEYFSYILDLSILSLNPSLFRGGGCLRGVMVKAMNCGIVVREFVLQLRYYIHFWANTLGKGRSPLILLAMG